MKNILLSIAVFIIFSSASAQEKLVINFDYNEYQLTPAAKSVLDSIARTGFINIENLELYGHCDSIDSLAYNDQLSMNRVNTVKNYFAKKGFNISHILQVLGFGERKPVTDNSTDENRLQNRRVEIIIVKNNAPKPAIKVPPTTSIVRVPEKTLTETIRDSSTVIGNTIILKNMNFFGGRHVLLPESVPVLLELLEVLKNNPKLEIEIHGHICCTYGPEDGTDMETMTPDLSVNRAEAVYLFLEGHGISKKRLSYKGFGHSKPLYYPEDTEEKRTLNRRVEIKIIKK